MNKNGWDNITPDELKKLFKENIPDSIIAKQYSVTIGKVRYKRKKWGISMKNCFIENLLNHDDNPNIVIDSLLEKNNEICKAEFLKTENIDKYSKALAHHIFRNGPIEDMHANGQLSDNDMKTLNKFAVNRIAGVLLTIHKKEWYKLNSLCETLLINLGRDWDPALPDTTVIDLAWKTEIEELVKKLRDRNIKDRMGINK